MEKRFLIGVAVGIILVGLFMYVADISTITDQEYPAIEWPPEPSSPRLSREESPAVVEDDTPRVIEILLGDNFANPPYARAYVGDTVVWKNTGSNRRRFWIDEEIYSTLLEPGESYSYTFEEEGTHSFRDVFNGLVRGTVKVKSRGENIITGNFLRMLPAPYKGVLVLQFIVLIIGLLLVMYRYENQK